MVTTDEEEEEKKKKKKKKSQTHHFLHPCQFLCMLLWSFAVVCKVGRFDHDGVKDIDGLVMPPCW
jgi:hypothetical protein